MRWKSIPGFKGYRVSDTGIVQSCLPRGRLPNGLSEKQRGVCGVKNWTMKKPRLTGDKKRRSMYWSVHLFRRGVGKNCRVHRLVLLAFRGRSSIRNAVARHIDRNIDNNNLQNLCWGTQKDNYGDSVKHGTSSRGERVGTAKLTTSKVRRLRKLYCRYTTTKLAKMYKLSQPHVSKIILRQSWKHVS